MQRQIKSTNVKARVSRKARQVVFHCSQSSTTGVFHCLFEIKIDPLTKRQDPCHCLQMQAISLHLSHSLFPKLKTNFLPKLEMSLTLTSALVFLLSSQSAKADDLNFRNAAEGLPAKYYGTTFGPCKTVGSTCSKSINPYLTGIQYKETSASKCYNLKSKWFNDGVFQSNDNYLQCLPIGYAGETYRSTINPHGDTNRLSISNSIFDDCSPTAVSNLGCGHYLECNKYTISGKNKWSCDPAPWRANIIDFKARAKQTCGSSTLYNTPCRADLGLTCVKVNATINGVLVPNGKSICLNATSIPTTTTNEKRGVKIGGPAETNYCYSGCSGAKVI